MKKAFVTFAIFFSLVVLTSAENNPVNRASAPPTTSSSAKTHSFRATEALEWLLYCDATMDAACVPKILAVLNTGGLKGTTNVPLGHTIRMLAKSKSGNMAYGPPIDSLLNGEVINRLYMGETGIPTTHLCIKKLMDKWVCEFQEDEPIERVEQSNTPAVEGTAHNALGENPRVVSSDLPFAVIKYCDATANAACSMDQTAVLSDGGKIATTNVPENHILRFTGKLANGLPIFDPSRTMTMPSAPTGMVYVPNSAVTIDGFPIDMATILNASGSMYADVPPL